MAVGDTRRLRVVIEGESGGAETAFERTSDAAKKSQGKLATMAKFVAGFGVKGAVALGAIGVAAGTMGIKTATQLEQVQVGFTTMLGSAEKAQKFMKQLQQFAAATPFEFTELVGSAQRFLAMGFAAKDIIPMLTAVGDAVAAMGGSAESVDAVTRALGQMQAKGKVSSEELLQLTEQGIPALQILADKFGVSAADMQKMVTKGKVLSSEAIPALIDGLKNGTKNVQGFGGMMAKQSETMAGKWSTFMDNLQMGLGVLVSGSLPLLKKFLSIASKAIADFFAGLQGKGKLAGFTGTINEIGLGLRAMVSAFKEGDVTSDGLVGKFELIGAAAHGVIDAFKTGKVESGGWRGELELVAVVIRKIVEIQIAWYKIMISIIGWLREHETVAKALFVTIGLLVGVTKAHAIAIAIQKGAISKAWKETLIYNTYTKLAAALTWAWTSAVAAAGWLQAAAGLTAYFVKQKAVAAWSKIAAAAQWVWNVALDANPIGAVVIAIGLFVIAIMVLWKHSEGFRKWVLGTLWPSIQRAWEQMKAIAEAVANAMIAAWNGIKSVAMAVWNALMSFFSTVVGAILQFFQPLIKIYQVLGSVIWAFWTNTFKIVWILIQVAVKVAAAYFNATVVPMWKAGMAVLSGVLFVLRSVFNTVWKGIQIAIDAVARWFNGTIVASFQRAFGQLKTALAAVQAYFQIKWNMIRAIVLGVISAIAGPLFAIFKGALDKVRGWLNSFTGWYGAQFDKLKARTVSFKDGVVKAFNQLKDGVKKAWDALVTVTKAPINFLIGSVYDDRIVPFWNRVAEKFGIKTRLDTIPRLATGGMVPGTGFTDKVPAMLTPGEGVLNLKEMKLLGGPKGFEALREKIRGYNNGGVVQHFADGGVVGFLSGLVKKGKDFFQGAAATALQPLANIIKSFIKSGLQGGGISELLRSGGIKVVDSFMSWIRGKDKEGSPTGAGGFPGALAWARSQAGKPYIWASSGPRGYDCSGFMSAILNHLQGRSLYQRRFSTGDAGGEKLAGMTRNKRSPFMIGVFRGSPGHTAGTLNGVNVESRGSRGVVVGSGARGWNNGLFSMHYGFKRGGLVGDPPFDFLNPRGPGYMSGAAALYKQAAKHHAMMDGVTSVAPGPFMGYNATGKRETLVNADLIPGGVTINGGLHLHGVQDVKGLRDELQKLAKRNGGRSGSPST